MIVEKDRMKFDRAVSAFKHEMRNTLAQFQLDYSQFIPRLELECTYGINSNLFAISGNTFVFLAEPPKGCQFIVHSKCHQPKNCWAFLCEKKQGMVTE